jgi:hypothetical protein
VPDLGRCTKRDRGRSEEGPAGALFASTGARAWSEPASGRTTAPEPLAPTLGDSKWKRITATSDRLYHGVEIRCGGAGGSCTGLGDVGEPIATPAPTPAGGQGFPVRAVESNTAGDAERKERRRAAPLPCGRRRLHWEDGRRRRELAEVVQRMQRMQRMQNAPPFNQGSS